MPGTDGSLASTTDQRGAYKLPALFLAYFAVLGLLVPYLPKYLQTLGFSGQQMSYINALGPLCTLFATPFWGLIADRSGDLPRVLRWITLGAFLAFAPVLGFTSFLAVAILMGLYAVFATSISPLMDALAVADAKRRGAEYARMRLFGSIGFTVLALAFGYVLTYGGTPWLILPGSLFFLGLTVAITFSIRSDVPVNRPAPPTLHDMLLLAARPQVLFFLLAGLVHWGCMQTYYFAYALHMENVHAPPHYVGLGLNAGVVMEILAMWYYRNVAQKIPMLPLMLIGQFATIARWLATGHLENGIALAALQAVHGLSFGLYFPACIDYLERVAPPEMRSTARALFASVAYGLGGILGFLMAGRTYDLGKGALAFTVAGAVEGLAPLLLLAAWLCIPKIDPTPNNG